MDEITKINFENQRGLILQQQTYEERIASMSNLYEYYNKSLVVPKQILGVALSALGLAAASVCIHHMPNSSIIDFISAIPGAFIASVGGGMIISPKYAKMLYDKITEKTKLETKMQFIEILQLMAENVSDEETKRQINAIIIDNSVESNDKNLAGDKKYLVKQHQTYEELIKNMGDLNNEFNKLTFSKAVLGISCAVIGACSIGIIKMNIKPDKIISLLGILSGLSVFCIGNYTALSCPSAAEELYDAIQAKARLEAKNGFVDLLKQLSMATDEKTKIQVDAMVSALQQMELEEKGQGKKEGKGR